MLFSPLPKLSLVLALLLALLDGAIVVQASPTATEIDNLVTLPFAKRFNFTGSTNILQRDQARARNLRARGTSRGTQTSPSPSPETSSITAQNQLMQYVAEVRVGSALPANTYELIVDTGSANAWVGAGQPRSMSGVEWIDLVGLGSGGLGLEIPYQSIGVASESVGFEGVDGVLGLGPRDLTLGTLRPSVNGTIETVVQNLFGQGAIGFESVSISFEPILEVNDVNGELTFGGVDTSKFIGDLNVAPFTTTPPSSQYFGVDQAVRYGSSTPLLDNNPGIFDTGTIMLLIATDALNTYVEAVGAVFDDETELYRITPEQYASLQSMFFTINNVVYEFTANAQIWPRNLNTLIGGSPDYVYLIVGDIGANSGSGMDIISGMAFMERFYISFSTNTAPRLVNGVSIANTPNTQAMTN
ncbi:aspartic proteinase precursor [Cubamyces menziesii]|nr:aspartic proteinase precursor [Cubamyces menziesii]